MVHLYIFCEENLSAYEKTILSLAISFGIAPLYSIKEDDIIDLSNLLKIDPNFLKRAFSVSDQDVGPFTTVMFGNDRVDGSLFMDNTFFAVLARAYYAYKDLSQLTTGVRREDIKRNVDIFYDAIHQFEMINATIATYECMRHDHFTLEYTAFDNGDFRPMDYVRMLETILLCDDCAARDKSALPMLYLILHYELYTQLNALYLITIVQIIKHSPFFDLDIQNIASELYSHLLFMLKNGRIVSIQTNLLYASRADNPEIRSRTDNTTRLQVLYGYLNFDAYSLRLDLAHKGEGFIHYNNKSPGGVKCCIFNENEYADIIREHPKLEPCFIEYGNRRALKERDNCNLTEEISAAYEEVRSKKEHNPVFINTYVEKSVVTFVNLIAKMLPSYCNVAIDKEELYTRYCFNYDKIMSDIFLLYFAHLKSDSETSQKLISVIANRAVNYGLISEADKASCSSIDDVCLIAYYAKSRVCPI